MGLRLSLLLSIVLILQLNAQETKVGTDYSEFNTTLITVETNGQTIVDEPKCMAHMKIIDNGLGSINQTSDTGNIYNGTIGIEIRGAFSSTLPQEPYGFETWDSTGENLNVPLFNMPAENDWILLANYNDKSFVRNSLTFQIFREMGHYSPRTRHCELIVNGEYQGIYVLTEKIKRDKGRVDIARLDTNENDSDNVTGGYIIKTDYYDSYNSWLSNYSPVGYEGSPVYFVYDYPSAEDITKEQKDYIQEFIDSFEKTLYSSDFKDNTTGYKAYIDVNSFVDYFILSEVTRNVDAYKKSRFFYKDKESNGGMLVSGPPWDYDWALKNIWDKPMFQKTDGSGWAYRIIDYNPWPTPPSYMIRLLEDDDFANRIHTRYFQLRETTLSFDQIFSYIDSVTSYLNEAQVRHYTRWPILGEDVGAPEVDAIPATFDGEISKLKNWLTKRLNWLDNNLPGEMITTNTITQNLSFCRTFPNPAVDIVYVEASSEIKSIELLSFTGKSIYNYDGVESSSAEMNIQSLEPGLYVTKLTLKSGETLINKIIKQ